MKRSAQACAPMTRPMKETDLRPGPHTTIFWLGSAGVLMNVRGTIVLVDPVLGVRADDAGVSEGGKRLLVPPPIAAAAIEQAAAVLYTHADDDHLGRDTARALLRSGAAYHGTGFVANVLVQAGIPGDRMMAHRCDDSFQVGPVEVLVTPAHHPWQLGQPDRFDWAYAPEDCCGFLLRTPDGTVWVPGDTVLLEEHLAMCGVDVLFADFSDDPYHFGCEGMLRLAGVLSEAALVMYHYGTYDAPDKPAHSADPADALARLPNPARLYLPAPGEALYLQEGCLSWP